jgi:hypothetical protein
MPAKAGIQGRANRGCCLDTGFRRYDVGVVLIEQKMFEGVAIKAAASQDAAFFLLHLIRA